MGVERKPFEIVAECGMAGFPVAADIDRISAEIEKARRGSPNVVRAVVVPPAIYRDKQYVLQARFLVWANDGADASRAVETVLDDSAIPCQAVVPTGRALGTRDIPPAPSARAAAGRAASRPAAAGAASPAKAAKKPPAKRAASAKTRPAGRTAGSRRTARTARAARPAARRSKTGSSKAKAARPSRKAARPAKRRR
jgi:hypothetical protein